MFSIRRGLALFLPSFAVIATVGFLPLAIVLMWSFWSWDPATYWIKPELTLDAYAALGEAGRWRVLIDSFAKAFIAASISLLLGLPAALAIHFVASKRWALILMAMFTIPFFTSYLIRAFSWRLVLGRTGAINTLLLDLGLVSEPVDWLLFSNFAIVVGLIASYLPFVIFPLLLSLRRVERSYLSASQDLGAGFWGTLFRIIIPLAKPGLFAGFLFVFVLAAGSSTEVRMLGGAGASMISIMINDVMRVVNFPLAFAISTVVLVILMTLLLVGQRVFALTRMFEDER